MQVARTPAAEWLRIARRPDVVLRSLRVAAVVGTLLGIINHGDRLIAAAMLPADWLKLGLTYFVPYGVSTHAAVQTVRSRRG